MPVAKDFELAGKAQRVEGNLRNQSNPLLAAASIIIVQLGELLTLLVDSSGSDFIPKAPEGSNYGDPH